MLFLDNSKDQKKYVKRGLILYIEEDNTITGQINATNKELRQLLKVLMLTIVSHSDDTKEVEYLISDMIKELDVYFEKKEKS